MLLAAAQSEIVRKAIEELPPEFREVIILREMEDLSYKEIAAIASIPVGTVMSVSRVPAPGCKNCSRDL